MLIFYYVNKLTLYQLTLIYLLMLFKLSKPSITSNIGVYTIKLFSIYSKKRFSFLKNSGPARGAIKKTKIRRGWLTGKRVKVYLIKTKLKNLKIDGSYIYFLQNKVLIKHRKLQKWKRNYGPVSKHIKHKRVLYKFPYII